MTPAARASPENPEGLAEDLLGAHAGYGMGGCVVTLRQGNQHFHPGAVAEESTGTQGKVKTAPPREQTLVHPSP